MRESKSMQDLAHEFIYKQLKKATALAKMAAQPASLDGPSRQELRGKISIRLGGVAEWIEAMDNLDRGY